MLKLHEENVHCPECGGFFTAAVCGSMNAGQGPDTKAQFLKGSLFTAVCPFCQKTMELLYPCSYYDPERKFRVWYLPSNKRMEAMALALTLRGYTLRLTTELDEFLEKVRILDKGYNDKAFEIIRSLALEELRKKYPDRTIDQFRMTEDSLEGEITFQAVSDGAPLNTVSFDAGACEKLMQAIEPRLLPEQPRKYVRVDHLWLDSDEGQYAIRWMKEKGLEASVLTPSPDQPIAASPCPRCGNAIPVSDAYCSKCGAYMEDFQSGEEKAPEAVYLKRVLISLAVMLAIIFVSVWEAGKMGKGPLAQTAAATSGPTDAPAAGTMLQPEDGAAALAYPASGTLLIEPSVNCRSSLTVKTEGPSAYYIKLVFPGTKLSALAFFVQPGDTVTVGVPTGIYELRYATGLSWYGQKQLFGENTYYWRFPYTRQFTALQSWTETLNTAADSGVEALTAEEF